MFGFAQPFQSRLGPALQRAQMAVPQAPRPMFDFGAGGGGGGSKFPDLGQQQNGGPKPMATQTAPGAADTASVTPVGGAPQSLPGLSTASAFDPAAAAGGSAAAGGDAAAAAGGGADFADLLAAIFGA